MTAKPIEKAPSQRLRQAIDIVQQLSYEELAQLIELVPALQHFPMRRGKPAIDRAELKEYLLQEMAKLGDGYRPMEDDDPFLGGMTVGEYFALPDAERERIWTELHSMEIDDFEEREVKPDAHIPARQEPRS